MRHTYSRIGCALLAICAFALLATPASARDKVVDLRVLAGGRALTDDSSFVTNTESVKSDRNAKCFFGGTGGSGAKVRLPGPTALGTVISASESVGAVKPVSVTDEFGFGLGVCGFGKAHADPDTGSSWGVKLNRRDTSIGGDQVKVRNGDTVTWYLATPQPPDYATPAELRLKPSSARPGSKKVKVKVTSTSCAFDNDAGDYACSQVPVSGAKVKGGKQKVTTGADGTAKVRGSGIRSLKAKSSGALDARRVTVCFKGKAKRCPKPGKRIIGRHVGDNFAASKGDDKVFSHGGRDRVDLRSGGSDRVNCGPGKDKVIVHRHDHNDKIARSCEKVIRKR